MKLFDKYLLACTNQRIPMPAKWQESMGLGLTSSKQTYEKEGFSAEITGYRFQRDETINRGYVQREIITSQETEENKYLTHLYLNAIKEHKGLDFLPYYSLGMTTYQFPYYITETSIIEGEIYSIFGSTIRPTELTIYSEATREIYYSITIGSFSLLAPKVISTEKIFSDYLADVIRPGCTLLAFQTYDKRILLKLPVQAAVRLVATVQEGSSTDIAAMSSSGEVVSLTTSAPRVTIRPTPSSLDSSIQLRGRLLVDDSGENGLKITTTGAATITVYAQSSSSDSQSELSLYNYVNRGDESNDARGTILDSATVDVLSDTTAPTECTFTASSAGNYFLCSSSGATNIYYITVVDSNSYSYNFNSWEETISNWGSAQQVEDAAVQGIELLLDGTLIEAVLSVVGSPVYGTDGSDEEYVMLDAGEWTLNGSGVTIVNDEGEAVLYGALESIYILYVTFFDEGAATSYAFVFPEAGSFSSTAVECRCVDATNASIQISWTNGTAIHSAKVASDSTYYDYNGSTSDTIGSQHEYLRMKLKSYSELVILQGSYPRMILHEGNIDTFKTEEEVDSIYLLSQLGLSYETIVGVSTEEKTQRIVDAIESFDNDEIKEVYVQHIFGMTYSEYKELLTLSDDGNNFIPTKALVNALPLALALEHSTKDTDVGTESVTKGDAALSPQVIATTGLTYNYYPALYPSLGRTKHSYADKLVSCLLDINITSDSPTEEKELLNTLPIGSDYTEKIKLNTDGMYDVDEFIGNKLVW